MARIFIGMETSGVLRRAFNARGHHAISCDLLPAEDDAPTEGHLHRSAHWQGDVFAFLESLWAMGWTPDLAIFHPDCTNHTSSAAWAFGDGPYHQKVKPKTLVGSARREARERDEELVRRIRALQIECKVIENPRGTLSTRVLGPPTQVIQPYQFGEDASKATCLWIYGPLPKLRGTIYVEPRMVGDRPRWANQTDSGQNRLSPGDNRWKDRARTYPGIGDAMADQWGSSLAGSSALRSSASASIG